MSLVMADQESRGVNRGDSGADEDDSVMRENLAEGGGAVNHGCRARDGRDMRERRDAGRQKSLPVSLVLPVPPVSLISCGELC